MKTQSEIYTEDNLLKPMSQFNGQQKRLNEITEQRYNSLSYFEREEVVRWLNKNLASIPILVKTKKTGMQEITSGHIGSNSALLLIRHTLQALSLWC